MNDWRTKQSESGLFVQDDPKLDHFKGRVYNSCIWRRKKTVRIGPYQNVK